LGGGFFEALFFRLNIGQRAATYPFTVFEFLKKETLWSSVFFTKTLIFLSLFYLIKTTFDILKSKKILLNQSIILVFLAFGLIHPLVFRNAAYLHDYMLYYLLPFFALSGALGLNLIVDFIFHFFGLPESKKPLSIIFMVIAIIIATEKFKFVDALQKSNQHLEGYHLGKILENEIKNDEKILVVSKKFKDYEDVFVNFYSDNFRISYSEKYESKSLDYFDWLIIPKNSPEISPTDLNILKNHKNYEKQNFFFFELK
jgi:hypothetical protein